MGSEFLSVSYLEGINSFVVFSEVTDLLFEFLDSLVKASLDVHDLNPHYLHLLLVLLLHFLLFLLKGGLVLIKNPLAFILLHGVLLFDLSDFSFPRVPFLSSLNSIFLLRNHIIGTVKQSLNFFLVCILDGSVHG